METTIAELISLYYDTVPKHIKHLGGGFYGRAFLVEISRPPYFVVAKLFLFPNMAIKEAEQIKELSKYATLKMPETYFVSESSNSGYSYDTIIMEYIEGIPAAYVDVETLKNKAHICNSIVSNLISYHNASNPNGFGMINSKSYYHTWQEYYYPVACNIVSKAFVLLKKDQLTPDIWSVFQKAIENFDRIFYLPINRSSLIHGDYNTWNIMLSSNCSKAYAVIDPCNSCWGDSEFDLYQLDNANGKDYELLKRYADISSLSENFPQKRYFYELFSEISHYHDANVPVDINSIEVLAKNLNEFI